MRRKALFVLLALTIAIVSSASAQTAKPIPVKIRAALFDRDLNIKPVPRLQITIRSLDTPSEPTVELRTSLEGTAEANLAPGKYQLTTTSNAELFGKSYTWDFPVTVSKADQLIELSNDNAKAIDSSSRTAHVDELIEQFRRVRAAAVLVATERATHDGILIDETGLVLTSHTPADQQHWIAVFFDDKRSLTGRVIAEDEKNDASIVRINMENVKDVTIPLISFDPGALVEGERVFSLDNNLQKGKSIRTGVISKADDKGIIGDVQFTDIGSPLFNSSGTLVGISLYHDRAYTVVPLSDLKELIRTAREKATNAATLPPARMLPVSPGKFPSDALIARHDPRYEKEIYDFKVGEFNVYMGTPVSAYQWNKMRYEETVRARQKRAVKGSQPEQVKEPAYEFPSIIIVEVTPEYKLPFWSNMGRLPQQTVVVHPKTSFHHMRLLCGDREVEPIRPMRFPIRAEANAGYRFDKDSMQGEYYYTPDSLPPSCGTVKLEIYAADEPTKPVVKQIEKPLRDRLWEDFEPFRRLQARTGVAPQQGEVK